MAQQKGNKKTTVEAKASAVVANEVVEEVVAPSVEESVPTVEAVVEKPVVKQTAVREYKEINNTKSLNDDDTFEVYSNVPNLSYYDKTTGMTIRWENVDDMAYMTFGELKNMHRMAPNYMNRMFVRINDERVIEYFHVMPVHKLYSELLELDLNDYNNMPKWREIYGKLSSMNSALKSIILTRVQTMIASGKIANINSIKDLEGVFKISGVLVR